MSLRTVRRRIKSKSESSKRGLLPSAAALFFMSAWHCIGIPLRCLVNALVCQTIKIFRFPIIILYRKKRRSEPCGLWMLYLAYQRADEGKGYVDVPPCDERRGASVNDCDHTFERNRNFGYNLRRLRRIPDHAARIFQLTAF